MTKLGILFASLLLMAMVWCGCSDNPGMQLRYEAEKMFYQAEKAARQARIRPELMTAEISADLHQRFGSTFEFCCTAIDSNACLMPQTVPNRPTNGDTDPTVARYESRLFACSLSRAMATFIARSTRAWVPGIKPPS